MNIINVSALSYSIYVMWHWLQHQTLGNNNILPKLYHSPLISDDDEIGNASSMSINYLLNLSMDEQYDDLIYLASMKFKWTMKMCFSHHHCLSWRSKWKTNLNCIDGAIRNQPLVDTGGVLYQIIIFEISDLKTPEPLGTSKYVCVVFERAKNKSCCGINSITS